MSFLTNGDLISSITLSDEVGSDFVDIENGSSVFVSSDRSSYGESELDDAKSVLGNLSRYVRGS